MAYLDWIAHCNSCDLTAFWPFRCAGRHLGWVHGAQLASLAQHTDVFVIDGDGVRIAPDLDTPAARTDALAAVTDGWIADGLLPGWRGERYRAAASLDETPLFAIERSAAPLLGLRAWGVHVNGFVRDRDTLSMWVAQRAKDRPVAPGKWDHIIAGGLPADLGPRANLIKEAGEEAGLSAAIAATARPTGHVSYRFVDRCNRLRPDTLLTYDLELPPGLEPRNTDGEVDHFELWPIARVAETVRDTAAFKTNCNLVIIDFLVRHGVLAPGDTPGYEAIVSGLRQPFPALPQDRQPAVDP
ncbi:MAG: DUF4743 domain-containing protein [Alphaproteobacteria bacterium]